mmetsp:Transcript_29805/g.50826  ORF Transcript_29805/g.50826 Transcript_29805/m.50826 type:complete len:452 (+) Transcript_29805:123-1478(+)
MSSQPQQYFDLNIPLPASRRKHQAQMCQARLHQLGYHGIAFCHTAFGRLKPERDDADKTLPWNQLLSSDADVESQSNFGRANSLGMKVYRRLNIVIEEVSDVSQILLPSSVDAQQTSRELFQKYDIISLQPMNEPVLQSICELLSQSNEANSNTNLTNHVQIINLEYATGSRGGHGLPYKLRKDYVIKVLEAGVTFELNYSTAMLDSKRRHGFLRTLVDFQSAFNGIQKKHMLLNKHIHSHQYNQTKCKSEHFPLLFSSGPRQNFTKGTDEGIMALRSPHDVAFIVNHLIGNGVDSGDNYTSHAAGAAGGGKRKKIGRIVSTAEKVLVKAREHKLGMITCNDRGTTSSKTMRALVVDSTGHDRDEGSEDEDDPCDSLTDWLSKSIGKTQMVDTGEKSDKLDRETKLDMRSLLASKKVREEASSKVKDNKRKEPPTDTTDKGDDLEDGFIAL